jgi:hypothetical protein
MEATRSFERPVTFDQKNNSLSGLVTSQRKVVTCPQISAVRGTGGAVRIVPKYRLNDRGIMVQFLAGLIDISVLRSEQNSSVDHLASSSVKIRGSFPAGKSGGL